MKVSFLVSNWHKASYGFVCDISGTDEVSSHTFVYYGSFGVFAGEILRDKSTIGTTIVLSMME